MIEDAGGDWVCIHRDQKAAQRHEPQVRLFSIPPVSKSMLVYLYLFVDPAIS